MCYSIHNELKEKNLGDITKVDETKLEPFTMICGGSPCQDFSIAGKQSGSTWICKECSHKYNPITQHYSKRDCCPVCGSKNIDKSRSSLLVEWLRVIRANKPNFGIYENVKNIVGSKFKQTFDLFTKELNEYGYNVYWKVLNSKSFGLPTRRERVYVVIIKKEIDNKMFNIPEYNDEHILTMHDIIDATVDEKYYLSDKQIEAIYNWKAYQRPFKRICGKNSICPTITARGAGEYHSGMILYSDKILNDTNCEDGRDKNGTLEYVKSLSPRVLTERESFRVMGFSDDDYESVVGIGTKPREIYRQSGNSICVDVLYYIYKELYKAMPYLFDNLKVSSYFSGIGAFEKGLDKLYKEINQDNSGQEVDLSWL